MDNFPRADPINYLYVIAPNDRKTFRNHSIFKTNVHVALGDSSRALFFLFFYKWIFNSRPPLTYYEFRFPSMSLSFLGCFSFFFTRYFVWWPIQPTAYRKQMRNGGIHTESWAKTKPKKFSNASEKQRIASGRFVRFLSTTVIYLGTYCFPRFPTTIKRCVRWFGQRLNWMHSEKKCVLYLEKLQRQSWTTRCVVLALFCWISLALRSHLIKRLNLCKNI